MTNTFLLNDFYTIKTLSNDAEKIQATVLLNSSHAIFKGHFEQMPVVPGVCQTQLIKELLQEVTKKQLQLWKATNVKYTGMIVPHEYPLINVEISYLINSETNNYQVDAKLFFETTVFTKFKGVFKIIA